MKSFILFIIIFINYCFYAQSIKTSLNFNNKKEFYSEKPVKKSIKKSTFYNSNNIEVHNDVIFYNGNNNITLELRYDQDGNLKQRLTRVYDDTGIRNLSKKIENWHPLLGYSYQTTFYNYDNEGFLDIITEKNETLAITSQTKITNDENGNPLELINFIGNEIQGKEVAKYDYENNEVTISYFNKDFKLIAIEKVKIKFSEKNSDDVLNEYGDVIKSSKFTVDIKYDKYGNWTRKIYSDIYNGKARKKSEFIREIKYQK